MISLKLISFNLVLGPLLGQLLWQIVKIPAEKKIGFSTQSVAIGVSLLQNIWRLMPICKNLPNGFQLSAVWRLAERSLPKRLIGKSSNSGISSGSPSRSYLIRKTTQSQSYPKITKAKSESSLSQFAGCDRWRSHLQTGSLRLPFPGKPVGCSTTQPRSLESGLDRYLPI